MEHATILNHSITLFWIAFISYGLSFLGHVAFLATEKKWVIRFSTVLMAAAFLSQTVAILLRGMEQNRLPLTNMFEFMSMLAWFSGAAYFVVLRVYKAPIIGVFVAPVIFMLMVACSLLPKQSEMQLVPALQSYWLQIHVTVAALGEAAFAIGFAAAIMYLFKIKSKPGSFLAQRLPDEKFLDGVSYKSITVGYPLFTVGALFAGAIWAEQAWGSFWSWDPKEVGSLVVWLIYSTYLHARLVRGWSGPRAAWLGIAGFICTLLTFFANIFLGGLHAYG